MPNSKELYSTFSSFPSKEHIKNVCKRGKGAETCRFLIMGPNFECAKATALREALNRRAKEGSMEARGDNCPGTLGFIIDHQELLKGNRTLHIEDGVEDTEGTLEGLKLENGILQVEGFGMAEDFARVDIMRGGIIFSAPYVGSATIFFDKPRETNK